MRGDSLSRTEWGKNINKVKKLEEKPKSQYPLDYKNSFSKQMSHNHKGNNKDGQTCKLDKFTFMEKSAAAILVWDSSANVFSFTETCTHSFFSFQSCPAGVVDSKENMNMHMESQLLLPTLKLLS